MRQRERGGEKERQREGLALWLCLSHLPKKTVKNNKNTTLSRWNHNIEVDKS